MKSLDCKQKSFNKQKTTGVKKGTAGSVGRSITLQYFDHGTRPPSENLFQQ